MFSFTNIEQWDTTWSDLDSEERRRSRCAMCVDGQLEALWVVNEAFGPFYGPMTYD